MTTPSLTQGEAFVSEWTGRDATALRTALRMTNEAFAAHLGAPVRPAAVAAWDHWPNRVPMPNIQTLLDTALETADTTTRTRFAHIRTHPRPNNDPARLWTIDDVSAYLGVPIGTLYQWRTRNIGPPAFKVGRALRYDPADIRAWLKQRRNGNSLHVQR